MVEVNFTMNVLPPTLNEIIASARASRHGNAGLKKTWTARVARAAEWQGLPALEGVVYLEVLWRVKNRRRDEDNIEAAQKFIMDGLVLAGVLQEDNLKVIRTPKIHHVEIVDEDGFSIIIRDKEALMLRLREDISEPPSIDYSSLTQQQLSGQTRPTPARQRRTPSTKKASRTYRRRQKR